MTNNLNIYEKKFAKSNNTDAVLVVQGKKLHVNKALLSRHSDYFKALFKEKSMAEIPYKDVNYDDFATLLSQILPKPILPNPNPNWREWEQMYDRVERLLKLAERFSIPQATRSLDAWLITTNLFSSELIRLADKFKLEVTMNRVFELYNNRFVILRDAEKLKEVSDETKLKVFNKLLELPK